MPLVEHYVRRPDGWLFTAFEDLSETLDLPSVNCRLSLAEIYDRVEFPEVETQIAEPSDWEQ